MPANLEISAMVIANTLLQHYKRRLYIWTSPDGRHQKQTDYLLCSQRWRRSIQSAKTAPGADCGSDHDLLIAKLRLQLKKVGKTTRPFSQVSQFSRSVISNCLWPHEWQHARPPCPSPTPGVHSHTSIESVMPSSHLILCHPLLLLPPVPPSIRDFQWINSSHEVPKALEFQL